MRKLALYLLILMLIPGLCFGAASRSFDGVNDNISMGSVLNVTTGNVSLCIWSKTTENAVGDILVGRKGSAGADTAGYHLRQGTSVDTVDTRIADGTEQLASSSTTDIDGAWYFVCGTYNSTTETTVLYISGTQEDTDSLANMDSLTNTVSFIIGESGIGGGDATGLMAYSMQFSSILTAVEVNELMWKPEIIVISTPNGFWPLWGDSTEIDLSGNGLTGTVTGATTSSDGPPVMFGSGLPL